MREFYFSMYRRLFGEKKLAIKILKGLSEGRLVTKPRSGICVNFYELFDRGFSLDNLWCGWPKASGNITYPIPCTGEFNSPGHQYDCTPDKWVGEQGELRRELCKFMAEELERN